MELVNILEKKEAEWWVQVILTVSWSHGQPREFTPDLLVEIGFSDGDPDAVRRFLDGFRDAWSGDDKQLQRLATMIEQAEIF